MRTNNFGGTRRGASLLQVVVALVVLFGFVALTLDYGSMVVRQRQLQTATDAAALAAGPHLLEFSNGQAVAKAADFAEENGAVNDANHLWLTPDADNFRLTVQAADDVPTPFRGVLDAAKNTSRVSAESVIEADPVPPSGYLAPLAVQKSYLDVDMGFLWYKRVNLRLRLHQSGNDYDFVSDPGTPLTQQTPPFEANLVAIDLHAHSKNGINQAALDDYAAAMKYGMSGSLAYSGAETTVDPPDDPGGGDGGDDGGNGNGKGNKKAPATALSVAGVTSAAGGQDKQVWVRSLRFQDLAQWEDLTEAGIRDRIYRANAVYSGQGYANFTPGNPRFMVLMVVDRTTSGGSKEFDTKFRGYVGFYVESLVTAPESVVQGYFVPLSAPFPENQGDIPEGDNGGVFTFRLTG